MGFSLLGSGILRSLLLLTTWAEIDHGFGSLVYVYGIGLIYDLSFTLYFALFFAWLLALVPEPLYRTRFFRNFAAGIIFLLLYGFYFTLTAEWIFWDEFHTRFNFIAIDYLIYRHEVTQNIYESYPLFTILAAIFAVAGLTFAGMKKFLRRGFMTPEPRRSRIGFCLGLSLAAGLTILLVGQPLKELSANNYSNELAANGPYQFVAAFRNNKLDYHAFYPLGNDRELSARLKKMVFQGNARADNSHTLYNLEREISAAGPERKLNVILITVESLSAKYLTRFGETRNITPFFDKWLKEGLLFTNFYATGTRTTRGLEAITLSLPPTPGRSLVKRPQSPHLLSLGEVLQKYGYDSVFLYGGRGFFENMNFFFSGHGYRCIDQTDLSDPEVTFTNAWGVADGDLFRKAVSEADRDYQQDRPFFFHLMTTSNHRPYTYPENCIDIPSGHGRSGGVKYTDYAFKQLISAARQKPWFADTIFVVVADHCAHSAGRTGLPVRRYHIPLFIYAPAHVQPGENARLASQIDIAPTLLGLLKLSYRSSFFGQDILRPDFQPRALLANYVKLGLLKKQNLLILSPRRKITMQPAPFDEFITPVDPELVKDGMAFYQAADYIIKTSPLMIK
jgi:phosphoglycerol transferase MdoB-like AlkP superfamily enzyme